MCYLYKDLKMHIDGEGDADGVDNVWMLNFKDKQEILCFRV